MKDESSSKSNQPPKSPAQRSAGTGGKAASDGSRQPKPNRNAGRPGGKSGGNRPRGPQANASGGKPKPKKLPPGALELKGLGSSKYAFQAPECALDRDLDMAEVLEIRAGGEFEIARDELLYLVADCRGFLEAYVQLAELALEDEDISLAKGHFGFAYENGLDALPFNFRGQLPSKEGYNSFFYAAGRGLARCLISRRENQEAREVLQQLLRFDPTEEDTQSLLEQLDALEQSYATGSHPTPLVPVEDEFDDESDDD
ncbi:MAG: hypothetical protein V4719_23310 [Planctomycetota bacterium]